MGFISRHPDAPYVTGEVLDGNMDIEPDISNLFNEFNGMLDNQNVSAAAAIAGTKFLDASVSGSKFSKATITTAKITSSAEDSTDATGDTMTTSVTLVDVPSVPSISITPNAITDVIVIEFMATYDASAFSLGVFAWTFSIGGTDLGLLAVSGPTDLAGFASVTMQWVQFAPSAGTALEIKPRYVSLSGAATFATTIPTTMEANKHFTVQLFPG